MPEAVTAPEPSPSELAYGDVSKAITEGVKKDRVHVVKTLANFGVKRGTELKPEQWAAFVKELA
jgi:hypothetical protein